MFQKNDVGIRTGLDAVLRGMVTGMWTAFEVLASDLWKRHSTPILPDLRN